MLVNKPVLIGILILSVALVAHAAFKQEDNNVETGKSNNNNNNKQKPSSSSSLASFTNREFVYGEDDDETASSSSLSSSSIPKEQELVKQLLDSEDMTSNQQQQQQQKQHEIKKSSNMNDEEEDEEEMDSDFRKVESEIAKLRKQRVDQLFKHDKVTQDQVRDFHRQADLQKKLLHKQSDRFDFDYEQMLLDQLLNENSKDAQASFEVANNDPAFTLDDYLTLDDDLLDDDQMSPNEISNNKQQQQQQKQKVPLKQSDMENKEQSSFSDNKPVVKTFKYNQKALSQNEYNNLLKNAKGIYIYQM